MYNLFLRIGQTATNDLREAFGNYIKVTEKQMKHKITFFAFVFKTHGRALVIDTDKDDKMVDELLTFKEKLDHFLHECFHDNEKFSNTLKDSFEHFINQRANKPAELIGMRKIIC